MEILVTRKSALLLTQSISQGVHSKREEGQNAGGGIALSFQVKDW